MIPRDFVAIGALPTNRGVAVLGDKVYVATIDARLIALDAKSGVVRWITRIADNKDDGYAITQAPLAINGKIIVGVGGGEAGAHGFLSCYDANDGKLLWRHYTVPQSPSGSRRGHMGRTEAGRMAAEQHGTRARTIRK